MPSATFFPALAININVDPSMFTAGPFTLTWHGLFTALGIIVGVAIAVYLGRRDGIPSDVGQEIALVSVPAAIVGARLYYCLEHFDFYFKQDPAKIVTGITEGGVTLYGGLIAGVAAGLAYCLWRRWPIAIALDAAAPGMILGQALGRVGDLINGEVHGTASGLPWAVRYTNPSTLGEFGRSVNPTAGYEMLGDLLILVVLLFVCRRLFRSPGITFCAYAAMYGILRFGMAYLRTDERAYFGIADSQMVSTAIVALAIVSASILFRHPGPITDEYAARVWGEPDEASESGGNRKTRATA